MNKSEHLTVIKYVMANPRSNLKSIVKDTGFSALSIHRFLTDYELKKPRNIFDWIDSPLQKIDKNGKVIGGHEYLFSVKPEFDLDTFLKVKPKTKPVKTKSVIKKTIQRDPITAALFGNINT